MTPKILIILVLTILAPMPSGATSEVIRDPSAWDFGPVLYYDRVVRGTVISASLTDIGAADLTMDPPELRAKAGNPPITVVRVTMEISEVLRGPEASGSETFLVVTDIGEALDAYRDGSELLVCLKYHPLLKVYCQTSRYGLYMRDGTSWTSMKTARGQRTFGDSEVRAKIASMDLHQVASDAELIIEGEIQAIDTTEVFGPDSSSTDMLTITMKVESVKKGRFKHDVIEVKALTSGMYFPVWTRHLPTSFAKGQRWLCFLQKNEIGWYPFAGSNGFLRIVDGAYVYDERVPYWYAPEKVSAAIIDAQGDRR